MNRLHTVIISITILAGSWFAGSHAFAESDRAISPATSTTMRAQPQETTRQKAVTRARERTKLFNSSQLAGPDGSQRWQCTEYDSGAVSCECKGMLDCKKLIDSGKCEGKSWWEAGDDPSIGGCDGSGP